MNRDFHKQVLVAILSGVVLMASIAFGDQTETKPPHMRTATGPGASRSARGSSDADKLSMPLKVLYRQFTSARGSKSEGAEFSEQELSTLFGIAGEDKNPAIEVALSVEGAANIAALEKAGAKIRMRAGDLVYASVPVLALQRLAQQPAITSIKPMMGATIPNPPGGGITPQMMRELRETRGERVAGDFDHQALTGKGVIVAVIDTGIDWA
ncbi:MAG TPA: hypothetical protein VJS64_16330, partial [Pyrinomonadaceae bacterium]|nr:hypothetical protein [Pyrinomonadaceae bacterium]